MIRARAPGPYNYRKHWSPIVNIKLMMYFECFNVLGATGVQGSTGATGSTGARDGENAVATESSTDCQGEIGEYCKLYIIK